MMRRSRSKLDPFARLQRDLRLLQEKTVPTVLSSIQTFDPWHIIGASGEPAFATGWLNYDAGVSFRTAAFWKDSAGIVHLRGLVKSGTSTIFILPKGYRTSEIPDHAGGLLMPYGVHAGGSEGRVDIREDGYVIFAGGSNAYVELNSIHFRAEG